MSSTSAAIPDPLAAKELQQQKTVYAFKLPIANEKDLAEFILKSFGVVIPSTRVCPGHVSPWEAFCAAYFARYSTVIWKASRGFGGKTWLLALLTLVEALTLKANVNLLGGTGEQSKRVLEAFDTFWSAKHAPKYLLASAVSRETRFAWGNKIKALMASTASVRGPHPQRLRLDEVDEMDLKIFDAATGQTMSRPGVLSQTVASSTHQYPDGTMTELMRRASKKGWPVMEWCLHETKQPHGWLMPEEIQRKRNDVSEQVWNVEYELQDPSPDSRAIAPAAVKKMFREELSGPHYEGKRVAGDNGVYYEFEAPIAGVRYVTGADWARTTDWTIVTTWKCAEGKIRLVAFERLGRLEWPYMIGRFEFQRKQFKSAEGSAHDATGLGDVIHGFLTIEGAEPVKFVGAARSQLFSDYITAIERGEVEAPFIEWMEAEHRLCSRDDLYGSGHPPDTISSSACAIKKALLPGPFFM